MKIWLVILLVAFNFATVAFSSTEDKEQYPLVFEVYKTDDKDFLLDLTNNSWRVDKIQVITKSGIVDADYIDLKGDAEHKDPSCHENGERPVRRFRSKGSNDSPIIAVSRAKTLSYEHINSLNDAVLPKKFVEGVKKEIADKKRSGSIESILKKCRYQEKKNVGVISCEDFEEVFLNGETVFKFETIGRSKTEIYGVLTINGIPYILNSRFERREEISLDGVSHQGIPIEYGQCTKVDTDSDEGG